MMGGGRIHFLAVAALAVTAYASAFSVPGAGGKLIAPGASRPVAIPTTDGGAIVAALDDATQTFFLNRFGPGGEKAWGGFAFPGADGVQLASDGSGGAIVTSHLSNDTFATVEHILSDGTSTWSHYLLAGTLVGGGDGGAWIVYQDGGIFATGVAPDGTVRSTVHVGDGTSPVATPDGAGGLVVAFRVVDGTLNELFVQHVDASGKTWASPVEVAASSTPAFDPILARDGAGGFAIAWRAANVLWVQDVDQDGAMHFAAPATFDQAGATSAALASDAAGIDVVWASGAPGLGLVAKQQISVTRLDRAGKAVTNTAVGDAAGGVLGLRVAADATGVVVAWEEAPLTAVVDTDLYIQRVALDGMRSWLDDRLATSIGPESFGDVLVAPTGDTVAVFASATCARTDVHGIELQRIARDGTRAMEQTISCP